MKIDENTVDTHTERELNKNEKRDALCSVVIETSTK